ncbi:MAG: CehA/McbA family metallohydrolase [Verrucomicrobiae bacterium]|nr:CehA/McbA family metallohydrolase [Verrucomicrobiae bacterium]
MKPPRKSPRLVLMPGCKSHQLFRTPRALFEKRSGYPLRMCRYVAEAMAARIAESKKQFRWKFFRGDFHSHTQHSDGIGTVAETAEMAKAAGLDFQFVTDHWGITQAPECREHGLWVGQEPKTELHHLGVLGLRYAYVPGGKFLEDCADLQRRGATWFIPHPTGWWPQRHYPQAAWSILEKLTAPFLMEICNGANNLINAFDHTDAWAITLWDRLLRKRRKVHAMGNTDAHAPHAIGMVWNGVFAARRSERNILAAVRSGRSFVSDGPLLQTTLGRAGMGMEASGRDRKEGLRITAADSAGLLAIRVIGDGRRLAAFDARGRAAWVRTLAVPRRVRAYVRVEAIAEDGRRAFSNPIYLR